MRRVSTWRDRTYPRNKESVTVHARRPWEPPRLYSWTVLAPEKGSPVLGALGVTDDRNRALTCVDDALRSSPAGARGLVHKVMLSFSRPGYVYEGLEARARFDPGSGAVVWEVLQEPVTWGQQLHARVTDLPEVIGDAIPPEAIAAGLADLEAEQGRP
jgi:hypothetical protein